MIITISRNRPVGEPHVSLHDDFERSSMDPAASSAGAGKTPQITIAPRFQTTSGVTSTWYFAAQIDNAAGKTPRFSVSFAKNYGGDPDVLAGYNPWYMTDRAAGNWVQFDNADFIGDTLSFSNDDPFADGSVIVSYQPFFGVTELEQWLAALRLSALTAPTPSADTAWVIGTVGAQVDDLGRTITAQPVYGFVISDLTVPDAGKRTCYLSIGVHAGEDLGALAGRALVDYLMSPAGAAVLAEWKFYCYPMPNPSGRTGGHYRGQWDPADINADPNRNLTNPIVESTAIMKAAYDIDTSGIIPDVFLAWHAWRPDLYGYYDAPDGGSVLLSNAVNQVSGLTHTRYGNAFSQSESWYFTNQLGAMASRVVEVGQVRVSSMTQITDLGRWHALALLEI